MTDNRMIWLRNPTILGVVVGVGILAVACGGGATVASTTTTTTTTTVETSTTVGSFASMSPAERVTSFLGVGNNAAVVGDDDVYVDYLTGIFSATDCAAHRRTIGFWWERATDPSEPESVREVAALFTAAAAKQIVELDLGCSAEVE